MQIKLFEQTGLDRVARWLRDQKIIMMEQNDLREILKTCNLSFVMEGLNRVQSTLICELDDSYVQQSQRYVVMDTNGYVLPKLSAEHDKESIALIERAFNLYERMTPLKEEYRNKKGRRTAEHYKFGIPIEDGRYILPLAATTNVSVSLSGDKLVDMFLLFNDIKYGSIFKEVLNVLSDLIPKEVWRVLPDCGNNMEVHQIEHFYQEQYEMITPEDNMVLIDSFVFPDINVGLGALTSTSAEPPSEILKSWGGVACANEKAAGVAKRVMGYGHTGVMEQARTTFGMMISLTGYHQQLRHRLPKKHRESLSAILENEDRPVIIPDTIRDSIFYQEYIDLVNDFKEFRNRMRTIYLDYTIYPFLLNCDQIKLIIGTNSRIDEQILKERTCMTAQWEIRQLSVKKLQQLRRLSSTLYEKALPPCVYGICKEGKMTCGKAAEVKEFFDNIN